jgi:hypothetical protein
MPHEKSDPVAAWALDHVSCPDTRIGSFPNSPYPWKTDSEMDTSLPTPQALVEPETREDPETFLLFFPPFLSLLFAKG